MIPNRKLVSYKILEGNYLLMEKYSHYCERVNDKTRQLAVETSIIYLYMFIKVHTEINSKVERYQTIEKILENRMINNQMLNHPQIVICVDVLNKIVYQLGLSKIEIEARDPGRSIAGYYN